MIAPSGLTIYFIGNRRHDIGKGRKSLMQYSMPHFPGSRQKIADTFNGKRYTMRNGITSLLPVLPACCFMSLCMLVCENPFSTGAPSAIRGTWKLVRNDAVNKNGSYDHDSPVGQKCPTYWTIDKDQVIVTTTEMGVLCTSDGCDTTKYCYMEPNTRDLFLVNNDDLVISGTTYSYEFKGDTLVMVDDPDKNPQICCPEYIYNRHFVRYNGSIPPDDSPCTWCE